MIRKVLKINLNSIKEIKQRSSLKLKHALSGSYTVEAAYIMPLLFLLIFMIMSYAFFFHGSIISNVWAAHLAEEERMAVSYGKIPFESDIYLEGFNDEEGFLKVKLLMAKNLNNHYSFLILGNTEEVELSFLEDEVGAEIEFSMSAPYLYEDGVEDYIARFSETRRVFNPQKQARIIKCIYRLAKQILFE